MNRVIINVNAVVAIVFVIFGLGGFFFPRELSLLTAITFAILA